MAPKSFSIQSAKKPYSQMVQPALPLMPSSRGKKNQPIQVKAEEKIDSGLTFRNTNGENGQQDTVSVTGAPGSDASRNGAFGDRRVSPLIGPLPITPQATTPVPQELAAETPERTEDDEKEVAAVESAQGAYTQPEVVAKPANNQVTEPWSELPATDTKDGQAPVATEDGQFLQSEATTSGTAGESDIQQNVGDLAEQAEQTSAGLADGAPQFTLTRNGALQPQHEDNCHELQQPQAAVLSEDIRDSTLMNGYHQPMTAAPGHPASVPRPFNALPSLQDHLLHLATTKEGVDWAIQVNPPNAQPFVTYSHAVILFRSLRLRRLMTRQQSAGNYTSTVIELFPARYVLPHAFEAALRFLYSDTVLGKDFFVQPHPPADFQAVRVHNLDYLISYWVAGVELGLEPVSVCAERLLTNYLDWDILEITYKAAMELANTHVSSHGKNMTGSDYLVASSSIIKMILAFIATRIDVVSFKLDTTANTDLINPRLPLLDDGRPRTNPALASMVFGSMPSSASMSPSSPQSEIIPTASSFKDTVASNILLNVDFENLNLFNKLIHTQHAPASSKLMSDVVNEREARRIKVLTSRVPNKDRMATSATWEPVGLKESIRDNELVRERVGFLVSSK